jgi:hypothetical protein
VAHLLGKDLYDVLANTAQPLLNYGLSYLQDSALLVIQNNIDAENDEDIEHEGLPGRPSSTRMLSPFSNSS